MSEPLGLFEAVYPGELRPPDKRETRIGWWFMWMFRPREVALRAARNELIEAAYARACFPREMSRHSRLVDAIDAYTAAQLADQT